MGLTIVGAGQSRIDTRELFRTRSRRPRQVAHARPALEPRTATITRRIRRKWLAPPAEAKRRRKPRRPSAAALLQSLCHARVNPGGRGGPSSTRNCTNFQKEHTGVVLTEREASIAAHSTIVRFFRPRPLQPGSTLRT
eukprot:scaffold118090_cov29-Tisochrysis_lutea.AAC.1